MSPATAPPIPTTCRSRSSPSPTPALTAEARRLRTVPAPLGRLSGALRVRAGVPCRSRQNGAMPGEPWKRRVYRVLDRFVPTVPFRYLPPKQSVRMAFNVILDREPDGQGADDYTRKLANGELSRRGVAEQLAHSEEFRREVPMENVLLSMHVSRSDFVMGLP